MAYKGYHSATQIIDEALLGVKNYNRDLYLDAAMYFTRGYRDFKLFCEGGHIKEAYRSLTAINTLNFPEDLLRLIGVGVMVNGEYFPFTRDDELVTPSTPIDSVFDTDREENQPIDKSPKWGYGTKGNNVEYYYKEDRAKRRVILARQSLDVVRYPARGEAIFRYTSNGITDDFDNTHIASDAANMLIYFIEWKLVAARPEKYNMNYIMMKEKDFIEAQNMYETLEMPSLQELSDVIYETSSQNVRRI